MMGLMGFQKKLSFASLEVLIVSVKSRGEELEMKQWNKISHTQLL